MKFDGSSNNLSAVELGTKPAPPVINIFAILNFVYSILRSSSHFPSKQRDILNCKGN
jgi:hypothetical protein